MFSIFESSFGIFPTTWWFRWNTWPIMAKDSVEIFKKKLSVIWSIALLLRFCRTFVELLFTRHFWCLFVVVDKINVVYQIVYYSRTSEKFIKTSQSQLTFLNSYLLWFWKYCNNTKSIKLHENDWSFRFTFIKMT